MGGGLRETILETFSNSSMKENADCSVHILALGVLISHRCGPFLNLKYIIFIVNQEEGYCEATVKADPLSNTPPNHC